MTINMGRELVNRMAEQGFAAAVGDGGDCDVECGTNPATVWGEVTAIAGGAYVTWHRGDTYAGFALIIPDNGPEDSLADYAGGFTGEGELGSIAEGLYAELDAELYG